MAKYRFIDFECPHCGHQEERFLHFEGDTPPEQVCGALIYDPNLHIVGQTVWGVLETGVHFQVCNNVMHALDSCARIKTIVKGNSDYNDRERHRLEKRSNEHWLKKGRDEAIDRQRLMNKKLEL